MSFHILGIGTASPVHRIEQADAAVMAVGLANGCSERTVQAIYRRSGVETRHSVLLDNSVAGAEARQQFYPPSDSEIDRGPGTSDRMRRYESEAPELAIAACKEALFGGGVSPDEITHLVTVSCSGFSSPGYDIQLFNELELPPETSRTHVGFMGCHGSLNGLRVANALSQSDANDRVLLCAVELCSLHQQYGNEPDRIVSNALFADGAAAVVGKKGEAPLQPWSLVASGSTVIPDTQDVMTWRIGNHGFEMTLSARVPDLVRTQLLPWLETWLARQKLSVDEIGSWAVHPGGPRILRASAEALGVPRSRISVSEEVLSEFGNMSSPTVLFILQRLRVRKSELPCVVIGFGPGLAIEAALIR